jgi:LCP family protein required for cell wall assembly
VADRDQSGGDRPEYKVYRSRPGWRGGGEGNSGLDALRQRTRGRKDPRREPQPPGEKPGIDRRRVLRWVAIVVVGWLAFSFLVFMVSAQTQTGVSDNAKNALTRGGNSLMTGSNVLVLGSDSRGGDSIDKSQSGPGRADSILLMHAAFGSVRKLSIPRDSLAQIPGHDAQKINAAYALGGTPLMISTVEQFLGNGLKINHVVEVDFQDFPHLIDALGGVTVDNKTKICAPPFDNFWKGYRLSKGEHRLNGRDALGFSRVRHNNCAPNENDLDRAARQQQVVSGMRGALLRPTSFLRLPLISWSAPKAIKSDMHGPGLMGMFTDLITGNSKDTHVLKPDCLGCGPGGTLVVSDQEKHDAVQQLLHGD